MGTVPFSNWGNQGQAQTGQVGLPGNTPQTAAMNYSFLPTARTGATQQDGNLAAMPSAPTGNTGNPNTGVVPTPYTANQYQSATNINNPFSNYTGFNLGLNSAKELNSIYGPLGDAMYYYLNQGAGYNPAVLNSLINQIQPQVQNSLATLGSTAGMTGNRFGSAYQLGASNFLSQVNQNELGMASGLYQHSQDTINQDMMDILGDAWKWKNNQSGILPLLIGSILPTLANRIPGLPPIKGPGQQTGPFSTPPIIPGGHYPGQPMPTPPIAGNDTGPTGGHSGSYDPITGRPILTDRNGNPIDTGDSSIADYLSTYLSDTSNQGAWQAYIDAAGGQGGMVPTDTTGTQISGDIPYLPYTNTDTYSGGYGGGDYTNYGDYGGGGWGGGGGFGEGWLV